MSPVAPPKLLFPPSLVPSPTPILDHASSSTPIDRAEDGITLKNISVPDIVQLPEDNNGNPPDPDPTTSEHDIELEPRDGGSSYYITLTVTAQSGTYITSVLLEDSFPTSTTDPIPTAEPQSAVSTSPSTPSPSTTVQHPGISSGAIAGIIIGILGGLSLLVGAFYVYLLRSRKYKKGKRRKRRSPRPRSGTFIFSLSFSCLPWRRKTY
jgi:hypothetical protein